MKITDAVSSRLKKRRTIQLVISIHDGLGDISIARVTSMRVPLILTVIDSNICADPNDVFHREELAYVSNAVTAWLCRKRLPAIQISMKSAFPEGPAQLPSMVSHFLLG